MIELRKDYKYALLVPTSMGVRLTPADGQPVHCTTDYRMTVTSAETNVASVFAFLGLPVKVLTAFVEDSPVSELIRRDLRGRGMEYEGPDIPQGGPWGPRHQFNIADSGCGARGPRVYNDRAGEVGRLLGPGHFDLERIFGLDGVGIVHMSGLIAALSPSTGELCLEIARTARKHGTLVSFDLNHRASFWKGRERELGGLFHELASAADILIGNEEDFQLCLGVEGPAAGGSAVASQLEHFREMTEAVRKNYPGAQVYANTLREVVDANRHLWGALVRAGGELHTVEPREITVLDRIGGGDGCGGGPFVRYTA
ncbi:MAG: PfkB family carbohydrate kinase, partial [Alistipes sp.]|nr:PfkB family carbohydrate kinase [Alistipes sp.]